MLAVKTNANAVELTDSAEHNATPVGLRSISPPLLISFPLPLQGGKDADMGPGLTEEENALLRGTHGAVVGAGPDATEAQCIRMLSPAVNEIALRGASANRVPCPGCGA